MKYLLFSIGAMELGKLKGRGFLRTCLYMMVVEVVLVCSNAVERTYNSETRQQLNNNSSAVYDHSSLQLATLSPLLIAALLAVQKTGTIC